MFCSSGIQERLAMLQKCSYFWDLCRAVAAMLVMSNHLRNIFFVTYDGAHSSMLAKILYSVTGLGHQAVMIFFVLSGLLIANSIINSFLLNNWSFKSYLMQRITRLYTVLLPALALGGAWDQLSLYVMPSYRYFATHDMSTATSMQTFFLNATFLQSIIAPIFGTNDPLWSLSYEFWYYLLFPCLLLAMNSEYNRLNYAAAALIITILIGTKIATYFFIWLLGVLLIISPVITIKKYSLRIVAVIAALSIFVLSLWISRFNLTKSEVVGDFIVGIAFALLSYCILLYHKEPDRSKVTGGTTKIAGFFASFSYTLYLVHFPFIIFLHTSYIRLGGSLWQPDMIHLFYGLILFGIILLYAWIIAYFTELRTNSIRKYLVKKHYRIKGE